MKADLLDVIVLVAIGAGTYYVAGLVYTVAAVTGLLIVFALVNVFVMQPRSRRKELEDELLDEEV